MKLMEEEDEKKRQNEDERRKIWQKDLDKQILEKNQKKVFKQFIQLQ